MSHSSEENPASAPQSVGPEPRSFRLAAKYFWRATLLRCPECGISPVFPPLSRLRNPSDLFTPLDGCPRCGYPYTREIGYFLMATWAVSYGVSSLLGLAIYLYMEYVLNSSLSAMLWICVSTVVVFNLLFARHARSYWLAIDHFFDPHVGAQKSDDEDGGGNVLRRTVPPPHAPAGPRGTALPQAHDERMVEISAPAEAVEAGDRASPR